MKYNLKSELKALLFVLMCILVEFLFLTNHLNSLDLWHNYLKIHFILLVINLLCFFLVRKNKYLSKLLLLHAILFFSCFTAGCIVYFGVFLSRFIFGKFKNFNPHFISSNDFLFVKEKKETLIDRLEDGLEHLDEHEYTDSYLDVMRFGSISQKITALNNVLNFYKPEFSEIFDIAINDESNVIRVQAATAVTKIREKYSKQVREAQKKLFNEDGSLPSKHSSLRSLVKCYMSYIDSGLLDIETIQDISGRILECYNKIGVKNYNIGDLEILSNIYVILQKYDDAHKILQDLYKKKAKPSSVSVLNYLKTLFHLKKMKELREFARKYKNTIDQEDPLSVIINDTSNAWVRAS